MGLQLFLTVALSAAPLTLYIPPVRSLTQFVEFMQGVLRDTEVQRTRIRRALDLAFSRFMPSLLSSRG